MTTISVVMASIRDRRNTLKSIEGQIHKPTEILICDEVDTTPGRARNIAASKATGTWLCFIDDDDIWDADYLSTIAKIDSDATVCAPFLGLRQIAEISRPMMNHIVRERLGIVFGSGLCIKNSVFNELGGFEENTTHSEIWEIFLRLLINDYNVKHVTKCLWSRGYSQTRLSIGTPRVEVDKFRNNVLKGLTC